MVHSRVWYTCWLAGEVVHVECVFVIVMVICSCLMNDTFACATYLFTCAWNQSFVRVISYKCVTRVHVCGMTWPFHMCDMTHSYVWHDPFICVTWLIHMCDMTHSYVWHDSFICVTCSFIWVTWLIHMCDMIHVYVWHDSCICVTWLIYMCNTNHFHVWHDSFLCPWLIRMCAMTHSYV